MATSRDDIRPGTVALRKTLVTLWRSNQTILLVSGLPFYTKAAMTSWSIIFLNAVRDCEVYHEFRTEIYA